MLFSELGLSEPVLKAVEKCGYEHPTPIQEQAIPIILEGRDLIGASQTGTGKTAAFALPLLTRIQPIGKPQILVLEPTRELADQVAESFAEYGEFTGLKVALLVKHAVIGQILFAPGLRHTPAVQGADGIEQGRVGAGIVPMPQGAGRVLFGVPHQHLHIGCGRVQILCQLCQRRIAGG